MAFNTKPFVISDLTALIASHQPFSFARWGDGEWRSVLGHNRKGATNCDGSPFYDDMRDRLIGVLLSKPSYILGMQNMALRLLGSRIEAFADKHGIRDLDWRDSDVLHRAMLHKSLPAPFAEFLAALRKRKIILVGPRKLRNLDVISPDHFVQVHPRTAFLQADSTRDSVSQILAGPGDPHVVLLATGMSAEILIDELHHRHGDRNTIIDVGSVFDPFVGVRSRSYMRQPRNHPMPR